MAGRSGWRGRPSAGPTPARGRWARSHPAWPGRHCRHSRPAALCRPRWVSADRWCEGCAADPLIAKTKPPQSIARQKRPTPMAGVKRRTRAHAPAALLPTPDRIAPLTRWASFSASTIPLGTVAPGETSRWQPFHPGSDVGGLPTSESAAPARRRRTIMISAYSLANNSAGTRAGDPPRDLQGPPAALRPPPPPTRASATSPWRPRRASSSSGRRAGRCRCRRSRDAWSASRR